MIKCEICSQKFKQISNSHLIEHGTDKIEYKKNFPDAKLKEVWNLGLDKNSDERVLKNSINLKNNHWANDIEKKEITSEKISISRKGILCNDEVKKQFKEQFKGSGNPNFGKKWSEEQKKESSEKMIEKYKDPIYFDKFIKSHWSNNEESKKIISEKHSKFMSEAISSGSIQINTGYVCGWFYSDKMKQEFYYMSSYELRRMKVLENSNSVIEYTNKHGIKLKYKKENGKYSYYIPDILITFVDGNKRLEEIKGYVKDKKIFDSKNKVALVFCKENNIEYKLVFKKDINIL
jgi:hypothetical protein